MKNQRTLALALATAVVFCLSPVVRAEMEHHHDGDSHGHHGERHAPQSHHEEHGQHNESGGGADVAMDNYFAIQSALAADSMEGVSDNAKALADTVEEMHGEAMKDGRHSHGAGMHVLMSGIADTAKSLSKQNDIEAAREDFGRLSEKMIDYQKETGDKGDSEARIFVCDMAKKSWLQKDDEIRNPYYGSKMLRCGRKVQ